MGRAEEGLIRLGRHLRSLMNFMDVGMLMLAEGLELESANEQALALFDCQGLDELQARWGVYQVQIGAALQEHDVIGKRGGRLDLALQLENRTKPLRLEFYLLEEEDNEGVMVAVLDR